MAAKIRKALNLVGLKKSFIRSSQTKYWKSKQSELPYMACIPWTGFSFRRNTHANIDKEVRVMTLNDYHMYKKKYYN